jgi:hypothetical protein
MYQGKDEKRPPDCTATMWPARILLQNRPKLYNCGHILWADNWFTGMGTIGECIKVGIEYVGTAKTNRQADAFGKTTHVDTGTEGWTRGMHRERVCTIGTTNVYATQWMDTKLVSTLALSTIEGVVGKITRRQSEKKTGTYTNEAITIPSIYSAYNFGKVGTDRMDQMVASYYRNTRFRWPVKVFSHMVGIAMNNAYITYSDLTKQTSPKLTYLKFILAVINDLSPPLHSSQHTGRPVAGHTHTPEHPGRAKRAVDAPAMAIGPKDHKDRNPRRNCIVCGSSTIMRCKERSIHVCTNTVDSKKQCWSIWHSRSPSSK